MNYLVSDVSQSRQSLTQSVTSRWVWLTVTESVIVDWLESTLVYHSIMYEYECVIVSEWVSEWVTDRVSVSDMIVTDRLES